MDGKLVPWDEAAVHVLTHTLHYGLGVFEGIRCYLGEDGRSAVLRLEEHTERLFASARIVQMDIPFTPGEINSAVKE
ncbi:MAG: branched chain amino acid aminotransferase, partial [Thermodesulfobacteriota bacterium]